MQDLLRPSFYSKCFKLGRVRIPWRTMNTPTFKHFWQDNFLVSSREKHINTLLNNVGNKF